MSEGTHWREAYDPEMHGLVDNLRQYMLSVHYYCFYPAVRVEAKLVIRNDFQPVFVSPHYS